MGWSFTQGQTRSELIARRIKSWSDEQDGIVATCLSHSVKGNVLWTVWEYRRNDGSVVLFIGCDLMKAQRGFGWGYKDMEESSGPYYHTCPLKFLDMVPVANETWRAEVRKYHARQSRKLVIGTTYVLIGRGIPYITITQTKPLRGEYGGRLYKVSKSFVGEQVKDVSEIA